MKENDSPLADLHQQWPDTSAELQPQSCSLTYPASLPVAAVLHLLQCCLRHIAAVLESCCSLFAAWYADGVPWARPGCCHSADLPRRRAKFQRVAIFRACEKKRGEKDHTKLYTPTYGRMYACMHVMLCMDVIYVYVMYVCLCVR